jgi:hypothetical protein
MLLHKVGASEQGKPQAWCLGPLFVT